MISDDIALRLRVTNTQIYCAIPIGRLNEKCVSVNEGTRPKKRFSAPSPPASQDRKNGGARAETQGFEVKLKQSFDPSAGRADVFPQDIRRALLNLIANGFYAATRRRAETNGGDYEPTLTASTKNLGDRVEVRIRDNGTGMTPDVKEKMFNPFFTTKPTGEGTGLGLSISHDIIVKQHAGSIEVDTQHGEFTEITIILPRNAVFL